MNLMKHSEGFGGSKDDKGEWCLGKEYRTMLKYLTQNFHQFNGIRYENINWKEKTKFEDYEEATLETYKYADYVWDTTDCFVLDGYFPDHGRICSEQEFVMKLQKGVLRSNCVDCLDRTNAYQSMVAGRILEKQISELFHKQNNLNGREFNSLLTRIGDDFQAMCISQGDALSTQYTGTGAHHNKEERCFEKMFKSAKRHYSNSFWDYATQMKMDLFTGNFDLINCPVNDHSSLKKETNNRLFVFKPDPSLSKNFDLTRHCEPLFKIDYIRKRSEEISRNVYKIQNDTILSSLMDNPYLTEFKNARLGFRGPDNCFHYKKNRTGVFRQKAQRHKMPKMIITRKTFVAGIPGLQTSNLNYSDNDTLGDRDPSLRYLRDLSPSELNLINGSQTIDNAISRNQKKNYDLSEYYEEDLFSQF
jgi:hypothetical protein